MSRTYENRIDDLKARLDSLSSRVGMFKNLSIDITSDDLPNDLLLMAGRMLSHVEDEIEDIYLMLYKIRLEQETKKE